MEYFEESRTGREGGGEREGVGETEVGENFLKMTASSSSSSSSSSKGQTMPGTARKEGIRNIHITRGRRQRQREREEKIR